MPAIYVLAGTNGAGKSSVAGAVVGTYFDPDEAARKIRRANPGMSVAEANSQAWHEGKRLLERSIREGLDYTFETTLGGASITKLLRDAAKRGFDISIWYMGLATPELHGARVRARVTKGGHDISEAKIRERFDSSRKNLIKLMPDLTELRVYDNSREADPDAGEAPEPELMLHMKAGKVAETCDLRAAPAWVKPILAAALKLGIAGQ